MHSALRARCGVTHCGCAAFGCFALRPLLAAVATQFQLLPLKPRSRGCCAHGPASLCADSHLSPRLAIRPPFSAPPAVPLCEPAEHKNVQFILLTPQDISAVKAENGVKILRMKAARQ